MTRLRLYHNLYSASSQKVRLALAEKALTFECIEINLAVGEQHSAAYRAINPNGVVPTFVHDEAVLVETAAILEYLDDVFPAPPLRPLDPLARQRMRARIQRLNDVNHPATGMLHYSVLSRPLLAKLAPERLEMMLGDAVSLLDLTALPNVARIDQMGLIDLIDACDRPRLSAWYARMKVRPSWRATFGDLSPRVIEEWQMLGRAAWPKIAPCLRRLPHPRPH